jgi:predicted  nucleic acid-binding Zn-ribbon protein
VTHLTPAAGAAFAALSGETDGGKAGTARTLVDRLRERARAAREENNATALGDAIHFEQAADEIERQRSSANQMLDAAIKQMKRVNEAEKLIEELELTQQSLHQEIAQLSADRDAWKSDAISMQGQLKATATRLTR